MNGWLKLIDEQFEYAKTHHAYDGSQEAVERLKIGEDTAKEG
jgi:hypothetical protein